MRDSQLLLLDRPGHVVVSITIADGVAALHVTCVLDDATDEVFTVDDTFDLGLFVVAIRDLNQNGATDLRGHGVTLRLAVEKGTLVGLVSNSLAGLQFDCDVTATDLLAYVAPEQAPEVEGAGLPLMRFA